jgi:hypothetical protein
MHSLLRHRGSGWAADKRSTQEYIGQPIITLYLREWISDRPFIYLDSASCRIYSLQCFPCGMLYLKHSYLIIFTPSSKASLVNTCGHGFSRLYQAHHNRKLTDGKAHLSIMMLRN